MKCQHVCFDSSINNNWFGSIAPTFCHAKFLYVCDMENTLNMVAGL